MNPSLVSLAAAAAVDTWVVVTALTLGDVPILVQLAAIILSIAAAAIWLRSTIVKTRHDELERLADTRKETIADLRAERKEDKERHDAQISELQQKVSRLQGQMELMQRLKVEEFADAVEGRLDHRLQAILAALEAQT